MNMNRNRNMNMIYYFKVYVELYPEEFAEIDQE